MQFGQEINLNLISEWSRKFKISIQILTLVRKFGGIFQSKLRFNSKSESANQLKVDLFPLSTSTSPLLLPISELIWNLLSSFLFLFFFFFSFWFLFSITVFCCVRFCLSCSWSGNYSYWTRLFSLLFLF